MRPSKCYSRSVLNCQVSEPSPAHLILPISLQVAEEKIQLTAIVDSGACSCFLDCTLARKLGVPLQIKEQQLQVFLADGSLPSSGPVTRETYPVLTTTNSGHQELLRFDVLSSPLFPVILGLPWLQAHNPQIDWVKKRISFSSKYCLDHCFPPGPNAPATCLAVQPAPDLPEDIPAA